MHTTEAKRQPTTLTGWVRPHQPAFSPGRQRDASEDRGPSPDPLRAGDLGHDFSRVPVHAPAPGNPPRQPAAESCSWAPAGPRTCPFGGACHTCPARIQAKLAGNQPGDAYEQEAACGAEEVVRMAEPSSGSVAHVGTPSTGSAVQCKCACVGGPGPIGEWEHCRKKRLQPTEQNSEAGNREGLSAPSIVHEVVRSRGQPLDRSTRSFFEQRFGHDFSQVRVHTDAIAAESARAVNALAYTIGRDIVFSSGQHDIASAHGLRLLAHELTHVLQQRGGCDRKAGDGERSDAVVVTPVRSPLLSRQAPPGTISRCRAMGVPCPAPHFTHGTVCRLIDCIPASTARLLGAISPGVCIYRCIDGKTCACVLVGSRASAVCAFTFCDKPGQASVEPDARAIAERALALATQHHGGAPGGGEKGVPVQAKLTIGAPGDVYEQEADRIAERVVSTGEASITPWAGSAGERGRRPMTTAAASERAVPTPLAPVLQRQAGGGAPACPTAVNFNFTQPAHVPHCGGPAFRATTNVKGVTWSLTPGTAPVDPGSTIAANGTIALAATQAAGDINARATASAPAAGGCFFERPFTIRSHPVGIASTSFVGAAAIGNYGGTFDHAFDSADGNVASLQYVGVGERFTNVPNPAGATHNIVAPLNPFGGVFRLRTATLTPGATNNWFLTAAGGLGGTSDRVSTDQANINVGRFVQSASNPAPPQGLPASMTLLQRLHWFCPQRPAASRWIGFVTVPHSRTLRNVAGSVEFVTAVNAVEQVDAYVGPTAVFNLTATPASTPRSAGPPAGGGAAPPARQIAIKVDTLPAALPAGQTITWSTVGNARGCAIAQDPADDHAAVLTVGTTAGTVTVEARDSSGVNRARIVVVIT